MGRWIILGSLFLAIMLYHIGTVLYFSHPSITFEEDKDWLSNYEADQEGLEIGTDREYYRLIKYKQTKWVENFRVKTKRDTTLNKIFYMQKSDN